MRIGDRLRDRIGDRLVDRLDARLPGQRDADRPGSCRYCGQPFDGPRRNCPACGLTVDDGG
ncbi:hypothetical protein [Halosimplex halobium]|uniref:hypothetical protein n=1 Tax=Halosimplex halobium TaxID=3396618 RepID=UPI003F560642